MCENAVCRMFVSHILAKAKLHQIAHLSRFRFRLLPLKIMLQCFLPFISGSGWFAESVSRSIWHCKVENAADPSNTFGLSAKFLCILLRNYQFSSESVSSCKTGRPEIGFLRFPICVEKINSRWCLTNVISMPYQESNANSLHFVCPFHDVMHVVYSKFAPSSLLKMLMLVWKYNWCRNDQYIV